MSLATFQVWRRAAVDDHEIEHLTAMWFDDIDAVAALTGGDARRSALIHRRGLV